MLLISTIVYVFSNRSTVPAKRNNADIVATLQLQPTPPDASGADKSQPAMPKTIDDNPQPVSPKADRQSSVARPPRAALKNKKDVDIAPPEPQAPKKGEINNDSTNPLGKKEGQPKEILSQVRKNVRSLAPDAMTGLEKQDFLKKYPRVDSIRIDKDFEHYVLEGAPAKQFFTLHRSRVDQQTFHINVRTQREAFKHRDNLLVLLGAPDRAGVDAAARQAGVIWEAQWELKDDDVTILSAIESYGRDGFGFEWSVTNRKILNDK